MQRRIKRMMEGTAKTDGFNCYRPNKCREFVAVKLQLLRRLEEVDEFGRIHCVSCPKTMPSWKDAQGGHYLPKSRYSGIMLDEMNVNPQCHNCNCHDGGAGGPYRKWMVSRYGEEAVLDLESRKLDEPIKDREQLVIMRIGFMDRIKVQEKRLAGCGLYME